MEIVPAFFVADKTRASLAGKSRAVHKVDAHPRWRVVSALKEWSSTQRRKGECARPTTIRRWWRLSVTARAALAYSSLFSSNPSHCANVFLLSRHSRRPTFQSGPFSVRPPARLSVKHTADRSTNTARQYSHDLIHFGEWLVTFFFLFFLFPSPSTPFPRSLLHFPCAVILRYNRRSFFFFVDAITRINEWNRQVERFVKVIKRYN